MSRILFVCAGTDARSGWTTYTRDLQEALTRQGHDVHTASQFNGTSRAHPILPPPRQMLKKPWGAVAAAQRVARLFARVEADVLHVTVEPYAMMVPFLSASIAAKTVMTIHGSYGVKPLEGWLTRVFARRYYDQIARFITVSSYTKSRVAEALDARVSTAAADSFVQKVHVVHNGIRLPAAVRPAAHQGHAILHVGGIKRRKGVLEAIRACAHYKERTKTPFHVSFVGRDPGGSYSRAAKQLVEQLGLQRHITFAGVLEDGELQRAYASADLLLMPATTAHDAFEGFGLVYLEANAHGVPCIGPNTGGAVEAIAEGHSGYHCDPSDAGSIAERMERVLDRREIRGSDCLRWAEEHNIQTCVDKTEAVYELVHRSG